MKVCMISFGATDYSFALANALNDFCEIDFYYSGYHVEEDISILDAFKNYKRINCYECYRNRDYRNIFSFHNLSSKIRDKNYDVIHIQEYGPPWLYFYFKRWDKVPIIMTVHDPYQHQGLPLLKKTYQDVMQFLFIRKSKMIIVLAHVLKKQLLARYKNLIESDVAVIQIGDLAFIKYWDNDAARKREQETKQTKQILFFGSVRANKGLDYLLKAEEILRSSIKNYELVIAGKFDNYEKYKKIINNNRNIRVIDKYIEYKDIPYYFNNAAFIVLPYISATQSGVAALAFTFGKPVVATKVGALAEMIEDGKTGLLVEPRNELSLATAIIRMLSDTNKLNEMGQCVRKYCKEYMSWESIAAKTIEVYKNALRQKDGEY